MLRQPPRLPQDLAAFTAAFEPMAAGGAAGVAARAEGFSAADPNGNGLCSLAELETYVLKTLLGKYPRSGKGRALQDPGNDLFKAFRPCYIRAFNDAKDYKANSGAKIKGTKKATDDDFVSRDEFQLFCIYVCLYAAMFDAFAKVDGGGAGRSATDDKRVVEDEWLRGYKGVADMGFVALGGIGDKAAAKVVALRGGGVYF